MIILIALILIDLLLLLLEMICIILFLRNDYFVVRISFFCSTIVPVKVVVIIVIHYCFHCSSTTSGFPSTSRHRNLCDLFDSKQRPMLLALCGLRLCRLESMKYSNTISEFLKAFVSGKRPYFCTPVNAISFT